MFLRSLIFLSMLTPAFAQAEYSVDQISASLNSFDRQAGDSERDEARKPAEVLHFLGLERGMKVIDVIAAGGWYTEVLAHAVGPDGMVYAQNPAVVLKFRDGANDKALTARLAENRLPNVKRWDRELSALEIDPESLDFAFTALNLHDIYNTSENAAAQMLAQIKTVLKPGGVLGIIDHNGDAGADNAKLHRMTRDQAIKLAEAAGFEVTASDLLANSADQHTALVFAPEIRGKTDRFVLKLTKPEG